MLSIHFFLIDQTIFYSLSALYFLLSTYYIHFSYIIPQIIHKNKCTIFLVYKLGNVWDGVTNTALRDEFKLCNVYARPDCKDCWARLYCAGGCAANALHATGDIHGTYEYGCKVFRKRMECALMMQVAQRLDPELAKNAVRFESDCDGCGEGNDGACEK